MPQQTKLCAKQVFPSKRKSFISQKVKRTSCHFPFYRVIGSSSHTAHWDAVRVRASSSQAPMLPSLICLPCHERLIPSLKLLKYSWPLRCPPGMGYLLQASPNEGITQGQATLVNCVCITVSLSLCHKATSAANPIPINLG